MCVCVCVCVCVCMCEVSESTCTGLKRMYIFLNIFIMAHVSVLSTGVFAIITSVRTEILN